MKVVVDDVGSFPLPSTVDRASFDRAYALARDAVVNGMDISKDDFLVKNFYRVVVDSFMKKCQAGLDVVNYPQHYDMNNQFLDVIHRAMDKGTYIVDAKSAIIPEVFVIEKEAKTLCEEAGGKISLRVCITGPIELHLREVGTTLYQDVLLMLAETVKRFAKNAILDSKHVKTAVISIDEPSFGFQDVDAGVDVILEAFEKAFDFGSVTKQIHLHSPTKVAELVRVKNLDVLSFEFAASPRNIEGVGKKLLESYDKHVRVGITRTDLDAMTAELQDKGMTEPNVMQIVEDEATIRKRFETASKKFGDTLAFVGPDCGLGGWPTQESAQLVLKRTVDAAK
jgi:5-methyltetrahydropteroyltriglutamate--homocysteine methyltransferase